MIKIKKGDTVLQVTNGAYNSIYKRMGYVPVGERKHSPLPIKPELVQAVEEKEEEEREVDEVVDKPLAQWNKAEVKQYAEDHGIDLTGTKNVAQAKERVQAYMDAQEEANEE